MHCSGFGLPGCRNPVTKGVKEFHKPIEAYVPADGGYFEHGM